MGSRGRLLLGAYLAAVLTVSIAPIGWWLNRLTVRIYMFFRVTVPVAPRSFAPETYGGLLNVLFYMPLGFMLARITRWWVAVVACVVLSGVVELGQAFIGRNRSLDDLAANSLGGLLGALIAVVYAHRVRR